MNDKTKADYRAQTLKLLESIDEHMLKLKFVIQPNSLESHGDMHCGHPEGPYDGEILLDQYYKWSLDPGCVDGKNIYELLDEIYQTINNVKGARMYPRGIYRELLEFSDKCIDVREKWAKIQCTKISTVMKELDAGHLTATEPTDEELQHSAESALDLMKRNFQKDIKSIKRSIMLFENERNASEESFLDSEK